LELNVGVTRDWFGFLHDLDEPGLNLHHNLNLTWINPCHDLDKLLDYSV
jgi:hypothetical protein